MEPRHILITNDDGIHAAGLQHLVQALFENEGRYRLSVVAPDRERSAIGHAITMHKPLRAEKITFFHNPGLAGWSVNGTPSDCVKLAVEAILESKPDLVLSGINRGSNLGTDVLYSGTVSAAVEGLIMGIPAIAASLTGRGSTESFRYAAVFFRKLIPLLFSSGFPSATMFNINIPGNVNAIKGVKATTLGTRIYRNTFERRYDPRGMIYYWLAGELVEDPNEDKRTDTRSVREGYISVTPMHFQLTNSTAMPDLEKLLKSIPGEEDDTERKC